MAGRKVEMPEAAEEVHFEQADPGDLAEIVRDRHRAEAAEWMALFQLFRQSLTTRERSGDTGAPNEPGEPAFVWHQDGLRAQAAEVACASWCVVAPATALATKYRLRAAVQLFEHLPQVAEAFLAGVLSAQTVRQIVDRTYEVNPALLGELDALLADQLVRAIATGTRFSANAITSAVDAMIMSIDPDGVRVARKAAEATAGVSLEGRPGGMACLSAILPGVAGLAVFAVVDALARRLFERSPRDADGTRLTLNFCRAVALVVLVAGRGALLSTGLTEKAQQLVEEELSTNDTDDTDGTNGSGGNGGAAEVTVTVFASEDAVDQPSDAIPVWIAKLGLLSSAAMVRLLSSARRCALRPGPVEQLRPGDPLSWLTSPITPGGPGPDVFPPDLPVGEIGAGMNREERRALAQALRGRIPAYALRYRIPDWLRMKIRARDGHCRFPGCGVPAADCDIDHLEPFLHRDPIAGGWTIELNLGCLCRRHHRIKTHERWTISTDANAEFTFTAPDGSVAVTRPAGPASRLGFADVGPPDADPPDDHSRDRPPRRAFVRPIGNVLPGGVIADRTRAEADGAFPEEGAFDEARVREMIREEKALARYERELTGAL